MCDLHYVDKRSCKICAPRCEEHGKVKAMCRLCRVEEANAVMNLTSLGAGEREKIQMMRKEEDTEERLHHQQQKRAKTNVFPIRRPKQKGTTQKVVQI